MPHLRPLRTQEDWLACRDVLRELEARGAGDLYTSWVWQSGLAALRGWSRPAWLVLFEEAGEPFGAAVFEERRRSGALGGTRVLRSQDYNAMRMAPFWALPGREPDAAEALLDALPGLARASGASLAALYKLDEDAVRPLQAALEARGRTHRLKRFNRSPRILLPDDLDAYWNVKSGKALYNLRRAERMLAAECGGDLDLHLGNASTFHEEPTRARWRSLRDLFRSNWEFRCRLNGDALNPHRLEAFYGPVVEEWLERDLLEFSVLEANGTTLAAQVNARIDDRLWVVLMSFHHEFARWSPGKQLFWKQIEAAHTSGVRLLELGGEGLHWKEEWANDELWTWSLSWGLGGLRSSLWELRERARQRRGRAA